MKKAETLFKFFGAILLADDLHNEFKGHPYYERMFKILCMQLERETEKKLDQEGVEKLFDEGIEGISTITNILKEIMKQIRMMPINKMDKIPLVLEALRTDNIKEQEND